MTVATEDLATTHGDAPRVTIVEKDACLAEALRATFRHAGLRSRIVDPAGTPAAIVGAVLRRPPDVVIVGSQIDLVGDGTHLVRPLAAAGLPVIVLAGNIDDPVRWSICLAEGATTVAHRTLALRDFLALVRAVVEGSFVPSAEQRALQRAVVDQEHVERRRLLSLLARLTTREREILLELTRGRSATEIATSASVSEDTVRTQIRAVLRKLEVSSQLAAVALAHRVGI